MTDETETPVCFFCYDDDSETKFVEPHPCKCTGTTRVHPECFATVLKSYKTCGACGTRYQYARTRAKIMRNGLVVVFTYYKRTITEMVENLPPTKKEEFTISAPGIKHGEYKMFSPRGELIKTAFYNNNKLHGLETHFATNGSILHTMQYVDGKREGSFKKYYPNGHLEVDATFVNDKLHGQYTSFYANDKIMISSVYVNGLRHGPCKHYYPRGELQIDAHYFCDKLHGAYTSYFKDGATNVFRFYDQGDPISN